ncbi:YhcN/YlaJ family sporulation lipoprotein [Bacillus pakistanensis]|uniref:YhcN/YlaJ family sporulation lipoprotein n=1 Tax=Rossellomorea pakistanensis TaxID=992288 RepID=A0ABS2N8C3_9BACI|nr:YhcN/YlaJ family sporulation lipoprotein [Bacillus pakistanensis]MBM7584095.1 YhcN/YlaJ family sporulation lipoprotein [Bacillus pakistanensis]
MKKMLTAGSSLLLILMLGACGANDNEESLDNNNDTDFQNVNYTGDDQMGNQDNNNEYDIAEKAADKVTNIKEVERAYVLTTENNAFVAADLKGNDTDNKMTDELEKRIADTVRSTDKNIENVNVSTNPDFIDSMRNYGDRVREGDPIEGLAEELGNMIQRVFPDAR